MSVLPSFLLPWISNKAKAYYENTNKEWPTLPVSKLE